MPTAIRTITVTPPADLTGTVTCNAIGQSGAAYTVIGGQALLVDTRDLTSFLSLGCVVTSGPTTG